MKSRIFIVMMIIVFNGCKKDILSEETKVINQNLKITNVSPRSGHPGDLVTVIGEGFDSKYSSNQTQFNGIFAHTDSGENGKIFTRVPLKSTTGNVSLIKYQIVDFKGIPKDTAIGPIFEILPVSDEYLNITHYVGGVILEEQSFSINCKGEKIGWTTIKNGDTIIVSKGQCVGDDSYVEKIFKFYQPSPNTMPETVIGLINDRSFPFYHSDTIKGIVAIQDWDLSDKVTGKISIYYEADHSWFDLFFWSKFQ